MTPPVDGRHDACTSSSAYPLEPDRQNAKLCVFLRVLPIVTIPRHARTDRLRRLASLCESFLQRVPGRPNTSVARRRRCWPNGVTDRQSTRERSIPQLHCNCQDRRTYAPTDLECKHHQD